MAKGNLFLGTAARSVGDVVMYRREGSQVSRVRVRKVANPRTDAQSLQRAAFSPVAKFFSPLAVVLERAFEGVSKSKSYSEFLKVNIKKARENGWLLPKGTGFFPLPYQLTKGTLPQVPQSYNEDNVSLNVPLTHTGEATATIGVFSADLISAGFSKGDVITIIAIKTNNDNNEYVPITIQFAIDPDNTKELSTLNKADIVVQYSAGNGYVITNDSDLLRAGAVIVARFENDKWRRSSQNLLVQSSVLTEIGTAEYKAAAVASYGNTAGSINPLVYLDGKDLQG